jgi:hypothetical protein
LLTGAVLKSLSEGLGHPVDHSLTQLRLVEHSIEAQLEFEHQIKLRDQSEIELARCFPQGKLILRGKLSGFVPTMDPEVVRSYLIQDGRVKGIMYINILRKVCIAVDWQVW